MLKVLDVPEGCFNMNRWRYKCGAPACTAGHAVSPVGQSRFETAGLHVQDEAAELLELEPKIARRLFTPQIPSGLSREDDFYDAITPKIVAGVIRNLVVSGQCSLATTGYGDRGVRWPRP